MEGGDDVPVLVKVGVDMGSHGLGHQEEFAGGQRLAGQERCW